MLAVATSERVTPIPSWPSPEGLESQANNKGVGPKKACGKPRVRFGSIVDLGLWIRGSRQQIRMEVKLVGHRSSQAFSCKHSIDTEVSSKVNVDLLLSTPLPLSAKKPIKAPGTDKRISAATLARLSVDEEEI